MSSLVTETQLRIYPYPSPRFWYLDPVYHTNIKLYISSLLKLKRIQFTEGSRTVQSFFVKNHPIKKVEIIAPITGIDIIRGSIIRYTVQDGSGLIDCVNFGEKGKGGRHNKYIDNPQFDLGTLVKVIGRLNVFNGKREIIFDTGKIYVIKDPNVEYLRWFEILTLMRDVYSKPFILPPNDMTLIYNIIDDEEANEDEAELIDDVSDEEESSDEDNDKEKKSDEDNDKEEKSDEDNAELTNNVSDKEAPFIMSKLEERLDEDNMKLIYDVSDKEDTPLIMSISEKKSDEDMQTSIPDPELFERMSILEDQSSQLTEDKFINSVTRYIYKNNLIRFSIVRIRQSTILHELATKVAANLNSNSKPSIQQVAALFTKALKVLVDEGFLNQRDAIFYYVNSQFVEMVKEWWL